MPFFVFGHVNCGGLQRVPPFDSAEQDTISFLASLSITVAHCRFLELYHPLFQLDPRAVLDIDARSAKRDVSSMAMSIKGARLYSSSTLTGSSRDYMGREGEEIRVSGVCSRCVRVGGRASTLGSSRTIGVASNPRTRLVSPKPNASSTNRCTVFYLVLALSPEQSADLFRANCLLHGQSTSSIRYRLSHRRRARDIHRWL
jgi:hypothetical protein